MTRRDAIAVGASVTALAAAGRAAAEDRPPADPFAACLRACLDCLAECEGCYRHCAGHLADGHKAHAATAAVCVDCGELCAAAAKLTARRGPLAGTACEACAAACDACAAACKKFDDEIMKACAKSCVVCAAACRAMMAHLKK